METTLIHIHDFVSASWQDFRKNWNASLRYSKWIAIGPAIALIAVLATKSMPDVSDALAAIGSLLTFVLTVWALIRLMRSTLYRHEGKELPKTEARDAWKLFLPFLGIGILSGLAVLGGFFIFVLPGIWLSILFMFSYFFFFLENRRGTQALAASAALVKGQWWKTFFRIVLMGFIYLVLSIAFVAIITTIIGAIIGATKLNVLITVHFQDVDPLVSTLQDFLQGLGQMVFLPLFVSAEVILFRSLRASR